MGDDQQQDVTFWIKETQRRGIALEKARQDDAPAEEIDRLQAAFDDADRERRAISDQ